MSGTRAGAVLAESSVVTAFQRRRLFVSVPIPASVHVKEAAKARSVAVPVPSVDTLLGDLPTAHRALPIGHRIAGQGCHGTKATVRPGSTPPAARVRFVYFARAERDHRASCHRHLVVAEILLGRVLAARAAGLRPMAPSLDYAAEARVTLRPPQGLFHPATLEYRRWYRTDGTPRAQPLTREALSLRLAADGDLSMKEARSRVARRSHALPAADQTWLIARRDTPLARRPLNQAEYLALAEALDGVWHASAGASRVERANRRIALRVAAALGGLLDEYVASPFKSAALSEAFSAHHLAHLRQTIENSRQAESDSGILLAGPKAWFAAKTARMRAEHQIGLAKSPAAFPAMQLSGRPMVAVVGGHLYMFVDGRRPGARPVPAVPVFATFG
ncbi:hypothetical protein LRK24_10690 [Rhodanobacter denitrificans]|uniref:hypothetical protein n=1 Tax=Rhodanobacter denitrificans TaxID=666685 RepID=UPI001F2AA4E2|nr:hypothetical protein [Rhodanobacter denitrificans]UJM88927.1 hypothetical protein LRK24_10690 [Rhodanobacter denitrificans]